MNEYKAVRSFKRSYTKTNENLNSYLAKGYEVVMVTPFLVNNDTEYLEYILKAPNESNS